MFHHDSGQGVVLPC